MTTLRTITYFYSLIPTSLRTIRCIGSVSATPVCTSAANDHHATPADEFERPGLPSLRLRPRAKLLLPRRLEIIDNNYKKGMALGWLKSKLNWSRNSFFQHAMLIITLFASATASFAAAGKGIIARLHSYPLILLIQREKYLIWV
jgi:hypothetical protein